MAGKCIPDFIPRAEESGILKVFRDVARTGKAETIYDFCYEGLDGRKAWWNWTLVPVMADGTVVAFAHMLIDVTEQNRAHEALKAEIQERIRAEERTRLLSEVTAAVAGQRGAAATRRFALPQNHGAPGLPYLLQFSRRRTLGTPAPQRLRGHFRGGSPPARVARYRNRDLRLRGEGWLRIVAENVQTQHRSAHGRRAILRNTCLCLPSAVEPGEGHRHALLRIEEKDGVRRGRTGRDEGSGQ